jgi:hypothetical protein
MEIKTLANCTDIEFLKQTNKIRHAVEEWLTATDIANIRKRLPQYEPIPEGTDKAQAELIKKKNADIRAKQVKENLDAMFDAMLEEHPEETLKIIRLCCFVEPDDDSRKVTYYLGAFSEMLGDKDVLDFFTSLVKLARTFGLNV